MAGIEAMIEITSPNIATRRETRGLAIATTTLIATRGLGKEFILVA